MKKINLLIFLLFIAVLFQSCNHERDEPATQVKVTFGVQTPDATNGRQQAIAVDGSTRLVVSLETTSGDSVFVHKTFKILNFGEGYVTEPIELIPGNYRITEFMLVNDSSVLYATPMGGSPLAYAVKHALPFTFGVQANKLSNIAMQVLAVDSYTPDQFGYVSFQATVIKPFLPLPIAVFAMSNAPKLISATVYILKNSDTLYTQVLGGTLGSVFFNLDPAEQYTMIVFKDGFTHFVKPFVYNDLMTTLHGGPLNVYLLPALTMGLALQGNYSNDYSFFLISPTSANVSVDWGDGTITPVTVGEYTYVSHSYYLTTSYTITVTGELNKITQIDVGSLDGTYTHFNVDNLPELTDLWLYSANNVLKVLDVRMNSKIQHIVFGGSKVLLPKSHQLNSIVLFNTGLASSLNSIIDNIYDNTVAKGITNGTFVFDAGADGGYGPLAVPSAEAIQKLNELGSNYGWAIAPAL